MTFLDTLRALDAQATPGPLSGPHLTDHKAGDCRCGYLFAWEGGEYCVATVHKKSDRDDCGDEYPPDEQAAANGGLLVLLRNSSARIAALVEAAGAVVASWYGNPGDSPSPDEAHATLRAAIAALDEVKS